MAVVNPAWDNKTIALLYRQGTIGPGTPGWDRRCETAIGGEDVCRHEADVVTHVMRKCFECGRVETAEVANARLFTQVHQGLIDVESAIALGKLGKETKLALRAIPTCAHSETREYTCRDGKSRKRCVECGRVWSVNDDNKA